MEEERSDLDEVSSLLPRIAKLALHLVRDELEREELYAETLLAIVETKPDRGGNPAAWLKRVMMNRKYKRYRTECRRKDREALAAQDGRLRSRLPKHSPGAAFGEEPDPMAEACDLGQASPDELVARAEVGSILFEEIEKLPEPTRGTLRDHFLLGKSSAEIAREQGIPAPTVRARVQRGVRQLQAALTARNGGDRIAWMSLFVAAFDPAGRWLSENARRPDSDTPRFEPTAPAALARSTPPFPWKLVLPIAGLTLGAAAVFGPLLLSKNVAAGDGTIARSTALPDESLPDVLEPPPIEEPRAAVPASTTTPLVAGSIASAARSDSDPERPPYSLRLLLETTDGAPVLDPEIRLLAPSAIGSRAPDRTREPAVLLGGIASEIVLEVLDAKEDQASLHVSTDAGASSKCTWPISRETRKIELAVRGAGLAWYGLRVPLSPKDQTTAKVLLESGASLRVSLADGAAVPSSGEIFLVPAGRRVESSKEIVRREVGSGQPLLFEGIPCDSYLAGFLPRELAREQRGNEISLLLQHAVRPLDLRDCGEALLTVDVDLLRSGDQAGSRTPVTLRLLTSSHPFDMLAGPRIEIERISEDDREEDGRTTVFRSEPLVAAGAGLPLELRTMLAPGRHRARLRECALAFEFDVASGSEQIVEWVLPELRALRVDLRTQDGDPAPVTSVRILREEGNVTGNTLRGSAAEPFELLLPDGPATLEFHVTAERERAECVERGLSISPQRESLFVGRSLGHDVSFRWPRGCGVRYHVLDAKGSKVSLSMRSDLAVLVMRVPDGPIVSATSRQLGGAEYAIELEEPGAWRLLLADEATGDVLDSEDVEVRADAYGGAVLHRDL